MSARLASVSRDSAADARDVAAVWDVSKTPWSGTAAMSRGRAAKAPRFKTLALNTAPPVVWWWDLWWSFLDFREGGAVDISPKRKGMGWDGRSSLLGVWVGDPRLRFGLLCLACALALRVGVYELAGATS